jgi:tetratricopeptide (TPR) repeat protein
VSRLVLHSTVLAAVVAVLGLAPAAQATDMAGGTAGTANATGDTAGDTAARVRALLDAVAGTGSSAARLDAAAQLVALGPGAVPALGSFLERERQTTEADRRAVLTAINAALPDEKGRFARRSKDSEVRDGDDFDWLAELAALAEPPPGTGEVMADVAAVRALAASKDIEAGKRILAFAFSDAGLVYRDECGRYLRKMAPYSLPALLAEARDEDKRAIGRYAAYQLERMDRKSPAKVLEQASLDETLEVAVLEAYGKSKPREAVGPILEAIADPSPRVRAAARAAWLGYVTGPEPPPAPKRKLKLPGGRMSEEEEPLWLTYRELADIELRRKYEEIFAEKPPRRDSLEDLSNKLFAHYDELRAGALATRAREAHALADAGDWAGAAAAYDRILAEAPDHPERARMASAYLQHGKALEAEKKWREAAAAYSKAHGLAPEAEHASAALAGHYFALGRALQAEGKDGTAVLRRAAGMAAERAEALANGSDEDAAVLGPGHAGSGYRWMLYAGVAGCAGALVLLILGLAIRARDGSR